MYKVKNDSSISEWMIAVAIRVMVPLLFLVLFVLLFTYIFIGETIGNVNEVDNLFDSMIGFSVPMFLSLALLPTLYEIFIKKRSWDDLGLVWKNSRANNFVVILNSIIALFSIIVIYQMNYGQEITIILSFVVVAFCEELMVRGILIHTLEERLKWLPAAILSSFLFAFLYHSGDSGLINLCWRFPLGFLLAFCAKKSGSIYQSVIVHFWINMFINCASLMWS